ncbi:MAG: hypothetical protein LC640_04920 [Frankia sp.]|nr:hypothetical protein [Frankia sp.]
MQKRTLLALWQETVGHTLNAQRRREFYERPEVAALAKMPPVSVRYAAEKLYGSKRRLLLDEWLRYAQVRKPPARFANAPSGPAFSPFKSESRTPADRDLHRRVSELLDEKRGEHSF